MNDQWINLFSTPVLVAFFSVVTGGIGVLGTRWAAKGKEKVDLETLTRKAVADVYGLAERQREVLERDNDRVRARCNVLEGKIEVIAQELHETKGALDLLKSLQCPLSASGQCPVFRAKGDLTAPASNLSPRPV